jgi:hypothetical protein
MQIIYCQRKKTKKKFLKINKKQDLRMLIRVDHLLKNKKICMKPIKISFYFTSNIKRSYWFNFFDDVYSDYQRAESYAKKSTKLLDREWN